MHDLTTILSSPQLQARAARAFVEAGVDTAGWPWSRRLSAWIDALIVIEEIVGELLRSWQSPVRTHLSSRQRRALPESPPRGVPVRLRALPWVLGGPSRTSRNRRSRARFRTRSRTRSGRPRAQIRPRGERSPTRWRPTPSSRADSGTTRHSAYSPGSVSCSRRTLGFVCVDFDRVLTGTTIDPRAARVVQRFNSWTEISPSGTGLHLFMKGSLPESLKGNQFEAYHRDRFIAVTGHRWSGPRRRSERSAGCPRSTDRSRHCQAAARPILHRSSPPAAR